MPNRLGLVVVGVLGVGLALAAGTATGQPADCFVAQAPSPAGPAPPANLQVALAATQSGFGVDLTWIDNSADETCFVIEMALGAAPRDYEVIATTSANSTSYHDPGPYAPPAHTSGFYRIYAATHTARSEYSNEDGTTFFLRDPTPSPTPSVSLTAGPATPAPQSDSPAGSPPTANEPSPALLPQSGGGSTDGIVPWAAAVAVLLTAAMATAVILTRRRRAD